MKASILIIEDEIEIADLIRLYLEKEGFAVMHTETAEQGINLLEREKVDLVVLDINLPGMDGFEFLQETRKKYGVPVVIVSARQDDADMILGLGIGADDYVTKPFSPKVLTARVRANLRRFLDTEERKNSEKSIIRFAGFSLDPEAYLFRKGDERIALSPREFEVLLYLVKNAGIPKTPQEIYREVWGNSFGDVTTVAVHIQRLRKKIENNPSEPEIIETVHSLGYNVRKDHLL